LAKGKKRVTPNEQWGQRGKGRGQEKNPKTEVFSRRTGIIVTRGRRATEKKIRRRGEAQTGKKMQSPDAGNGYVLKMDHPLQKKRGKKSR